MLFLGCVVEKITSQNNQSALVICGDHISAGNYL